MRTSSVLLSLFGLLALDNISYVLGSDETEIKVDDELEMEHEEEEDEGFDEENFDQGQYGDNMDASGMMGLTEEDAKARMKELFHKIDEDSDGNISEEEATAFAHKADKMAKDVHGESEFETLDTNKDGFISLEEMLTLYSQYGQDANNEEDKKFGEERFHAIDQNSDGKLDLAEIRILLDPGQSEKLVAVEATGIMRMQDKNKDAGIDFHEYADTAEDKLTEEEVTSLRKDFDSFDTNQDGTIDEGEVKEVIRNMSQVEIKRGVDEFMTIVQTDEEKATKPKPLWVSLEDFLANAKKLITSVLTADGDLIRVPEKYPALGLSFKNIETPKPQGFGDDMDGSDAMFGDMTDEKIAQLMKQFETQKGGDEEEAVDAPEEGIKEEL